MVLPSTFIGLIADGLALQSAQALSGSSSSSSSVSGSGDSPPANRAYAGQGNHNLSVGDVDGDGKDEIVYGHMAVDEDGRGLYTTGIGHGDAFS